MQEDLLLLACGLYSLHVVTAVTALACLSQQHLVPIGPMIERLTIFLSVASAVTVIMVPLFA